jgi:PAS domain-containing protein
VVPVALADGLLLWLKPDASPTPGEARALDRLQQAERATRFLDRALGLAGVSVWRLDLETGRIHFNATGFAGAGITPDPAGVPVDAIRATIHPDDLERIVRGADEAIASDRVVDVVARYRAPDGSWRTLLTRRVADRDAAGRALGLAGISIDL